MGLSAKEFTQTPWCNTRCLAFEVPIESTQYASCGPRFGRNCGGRNLGSRPQLMRLGRRISMVRKDFGTLISRIA